MKITPSSKLRSFIEHRYDVMIREEQKEKIAKSEYKKEKDKCRKKIERRFVDDIKKRTRALSLMNHIYKVRLKNLLDGKEHSQFNLFLFISWHLIKTEQKADNVDIYKWIVLFLKKMGCNRPNLYKKDIKRRVESIKIHRNIFSLIDHIYSDYN
jgi:hypothetical protein